MTSQNLAKAADIAPIIEGLHGEQHPELTRVREIAQQLHTSDDAARSAELFTELRVVTNNYTLPDDACAAFTMTYEALQAADQEQSA